MYFSCSFELLLCFLTTTKHISNIQHTAKGGGSPISSFLFSYISVVSLMSLYRSFSIYLSWTSLSLQYGKPYSLRCLPKNTYLPSYYLHPSIKEILITYSTLVPFNFLITYLISHQLAFLDDFYKADSSCMAGGAAFSSTTCMMTLFFSLLLAFNFAMAVPKCTLFTPLTSTKDGAKKRNTMVADSAREGTTTQNTKIMDITPKQTTKGINVPDLLRGPKGGPSRSAPRPPLQWQNKIFNASEHEVPSGPNPISN